MISSAEKGGDHIFFCADEEQRKSFLVRGYHPYINMGLPLAGVKMASNRHAME